MKRFLLALAVIFSIALPTALAQFSGAGTFASPYIVGVVNNSLSFTSSGIAAGSSAIYYQFSIYTTAPIGGTIDISFAVGDGNSLYLLALYSGSNRLVGGSLGNTSTTTFRNRVTLTSALQPGTYLLQVAEGGVSGTTGPDYTFNFSLGNNSTPVTLYRPVNQSPINGATDQSTAPRLIVSPYGDNNAYGTPISSEWVIRRSADNMLFADAQISGTYNAVDVTGLALGAAYYFQARYYNNAGEWTPFSAATSFTTAAVWPPRISVTVANALAVKSPLHRGVFRVSRTLSTGTATVLLKVAGTAIPASDYQAITSSVTLFPGVKSIDIPITPIPNLAYSGKRSVSITPQPVTGYVVSEAAVLAIRSKLLSSRLMVREGNQYLFDLTGNGGAATKTMTLGNGTEKVLYGDFNKDGIDDIVVRSGKIYTITMSGSTGARWQSIGFGTAASQAFTGDYNGDGQDELFTRTGNQFAVDTRHTGGVPGVTFTFGLPTDELVLSSDKVRTGDWDGDGCDDVVLRRGNLFLVRSSRTGTVSTFNFGNASDLVYLADMNGDGKFEPVVWNRVNSYRSDVNHYPSYPLIQSFGFSSDHAYAADLNGDGRAELIIKRLNRYLIDLDHNGSAAEKAIYFGSATNSVSIWFPRQ